jgi:osmoprotectant transport system ATP-binding protein
MTARMLSAQGVTKRYENDHAALSDLTLEVARGETLALVGPSGCGKSTLLRVFLGLLRPDAGSIRFDGRLLAEQDLGKMRRRIGYVVQNGGLFPHLTVRENAELVARWLRRPKEDVAARTLALAAQVKLPEVLLDRYPLELSGGQRQRAALLRALFLDPDVMLLDEPLGALDPIVRLELQDELRALFRSLGKTVLIVTHDLAEAAFFVHRIGVMRRGTLLQLGPIEELRRQPADPYVARFFDAYRAFLPTEGA